MTNKCTFIDGVASSQAIDTAGEVVDIAGLDCSSLLGAPFNWEHKSDTPAQIVGKILEFKKIFSEKDCETDRQKYFWEKVNMPFLYVLGRLFDDKKDSSKELAALFMDDAQHPTEHPMVGFSVEGAKIDKQGMVITRSIARKITCTALPANKSCVAEMIPAQKSKRGDPDSLFKGEIEFFNPSAKYLETLQKKEELLEKGLKHALVGGLALLGSHGAHAAGSDLHQLVSGLGKLPGVKVSAQFNPYVKNGKHGEGKYAVHVGKYSVKGDYSSNGSATNHQHSLDGPDNGGPGDPDYAKAKFLSDKLRTVGNRVLERAEKMAKACDLHKATTGRTGGRSDISGHEKGVHLPIAAGPQKGQSVMGSHITAPSSVGHGSKEMARRHSQSNLRDLKAMPKPNLPKSENMQKDVGSGGGAMIGSSLAMSELAKSVPSWNHSGNGNFSHPEHGAVSVAKQPNGEFHVRHNGGMANMGGKKAIFGSAGEAGAHAGAYMTALSSKKIGGNPMHNRPSPQMPNMGKSLEAGSGMGAPSTLTQGAALAREDLGGKVKKAFGMGGGFGMMSGRGGMNDRVRGQTASVGTSMNTTVGKSEKKSKWLARAEEAYKIWEKREQFENFMAKKMPHLTKGEIQAIGQTLALKKSVEAEKELSKFATFFNKGTDIMMAKEPKK